MPQRCATEPQRPPPWSAVMLALGGAIAFSGKAIIGSACVLLAVWLLARVG